MLPVVALAALLPMINAAPAEVKRADACTFTDAAAAIKGKASCSTITLNNIAVPAGTTLDLTKLKTGTKVCIFAVQRGVTIGADTLSSTPGHFPGYHFLWLQGMGGPPHLRLRNGHHRHRRLGPRD